MTHGENLLQKLEPAVRPLTAEFIDPLRSAETVATTTPSAGLPFQHLIDQAVAGELTTGRRITMASGIDLAQAEIEQISAAADRAEAAGGKRAIVVLGHDVYVLDIAERRLTESIRLSSAEPGFENAASGQVRLDNARWRVDGASDVATSGESDANRAQLALSATEMTGNLAARIEQQNTMGLVVGGDDATPGERIISGIDTAIMLIRDADETDQTGHSAPRMLAQLRGAVVNGSAKLLQISG